MITTRKRLSAIGAIIALSVAGLAGCSNEAKDGKATMEPAAMSTEATPSADGMTKTAETNDAAMATFPMEFKNADGSTTTIPAKPKRIVSTAVTLTGMAVPFNAPIVASATDADADFFPAWKADAEKLNIEKMWAARTPANLEAVTAAKPDLILVSDTGADSVAKQMAELQKIAPTVLINYSSKSWQDVTKQLGEVTGMPKEANAVVDEFNKSVSDLAAKIKHPEGKINVVSYNGPGKRNAVALQEGPYGDLFKALGFDFEQPKDEWNNPDQPSRRTDFVFTSIEHLTELTGDTTFLIHADQATADKMITEPVLANVPSVQKKQVYPLGKQVFRLDYYTSHLVMDKLAQLYAK